MRERLIRYRGWIVASFLAMVLIAGLIFFFSGQQGDASTGLSQGVTTWLLEHFYPDYAAQTAAVKRQLIRSWHHGVRKLAHFSEYALLGASVATFVHALHSGKRRRLLCVLSWLPCVAYAGTDELHQMFVDGRGPALLDVAIDSCGALAGVLAMALVLELRRRRLQARAQAH